MDRYRCAQSTAGSAPPDPLAYLVTLLGFHAVGGGGAGDEAADTDGLAALLAPAVAAVVDAGDGLVDLVEELALPVTHPQFQGVILLQGGPVRGIGRGLIVLKMQGGVLGGAQQRVLFRHQAGAEEGQLARRHVVRFRRGQHFLGGRQRFRDGVCCVHLLSLLLGRLQDRGVTIGTRYTPTAPMGKPIAGAWITMAMFPMESTCGWRRSPVNFREKCGNGA